MAPSPLLAVAVEDKGGKKYMFLYCNYSGARSQNSEARIKRKPVLVMVILCQCPN